MWSFKNLAKSSKLLIDTDQRGLPLVFCFLWSPGETWQCCKVDLELWVILWGSKNVSLELGLVTGAG